MKQRRRNADAGSSFERISLIFGVSGHRDLFPSDVAKLSEQLQHIFSRFHAAYPDTPLKLLTPLAEGADRLAARVALSSKIELLVPMPMKQQEYERDFAAAESLAEFRQLLAMASSHWEIPTVLDCAGEYRTKQYAAVGDFIACRSHVLILLWDGEDNRKVGGTAWVKRRREYWVKLAADRDINPFRYGPVIHVVTPRVSSDRPRPRVKTRGRLPLSEVEFAATLSDVRIARPRKKQQERPALYQLVYWAINRFNSGLPAKGGRKRAQRQSATRSRQ